MTSTPWRPVSYTHLDVYKRQTLDSDEEIEEIYNLFMERFFQEEDE